MSVKRSAVRPQPKSRLGSTPTAKPTDAAPNTSTLEINVFDGTRQPISAGTSVLYRVIDGNQKRVLAQEEKTSSLTVTGLQFFDNFGDNYTTTRRSFLPTGTSKPGSPRSNFLRRFL